MKKTLTVNLGGTVFHIDEDAYRLLDDYLKNLRIHFEGESGAAEIVDDMEQRISELFAEKMGAGHGVVTLADVEEVIARMGRPEDIDMAGAESACGTNRERKKENVPHTGIRRRLFRNPDDKIFGGVLSGIATYLDWNVTLLRVLLILCFFFSWGTVTLIYLACWLVIPEARTAAEKLSMRGEAVTLENIGKTVTDSFERVSDNVNNYIHSGAPRSFFQRLGDAVVTAFGWCLKIALVVLAVICSPALFALGITFIALLIAAIAVAIGGGAALLSLFPEIVWIMPSSPMLAIGMYMAGLLLVGIPLLGLISLVFGKAYRWLSLSTGLKWTLLVLWIVCAIIFIWGIVAGGMTVPHWGVIV